MESAFRARSARRRRDGAPPTLLVERGTDLGKRYRTHPWPALVAPLESSVVRLEWDEDRAEAAPKMLDRAHVALLPAGHRHRARAVSPVVSLVTWLLAPGPISRAYREYPGHVLPAVFPRLLSRPRLLPRTRWVDELVHRYVFERDVCDKHESNAALFLETELAKELYFLCKEQDEAKTRATVVREEGDLVARARARIDEVLFSPLRVPELARHCHTSESTLMRAFRRELGVTPATYARERRLDAALLLLQSGRHRVGEVAERVGYTSFAAFSAAFRRRFGAAPSAHQGATEGAPVLPPHGEPAAPGHGPPRRSRSS